MTGVVRPGAAFILLVGLAMSAAAADQPTDRVEEFMGRSNLHPAFEKLGRGLSNILGGWLGIPVNMHARYSRSDTAGSLVTGTLCGIVKGIVRTGVGAYETATFFLPYPKHFAPILPTLAYFDRTTKHKPLPLE